MNKNSTLNHIILIHNCNVKNVLEVQEALKNFPLSKFSVWNEQYTIINHNNYNATTLQVMIMWDVNLLQMKYGSFQLVCVNYLIT